MGIEGLAYIITTKNINHQSNYKLGNDVNYYIDCMGLLNDVCDYLSSKYKKENSSLLKNTLKNDLIENNLFEELVNLNINEFINKSAIYILETINKCKERDQITNKRSNINIYFDYYYDIYPKTRLPMEYLIPLYNNMPDKHKFLSIPLGNKNNNEDYKALYYVSKDDDLNNYENLYALQQSTINNNKIYDVLSSYIIKRYLKSVTRNQRLENKTCNLTNNMEKYNRFYRGMISNLILPVIEKFKEIGGQLMLNNNIKFYGCNIESDFAIAKDVQDDNGYKKIITNDTDFLLLLSNVNNCEIILKMDKYNIYNRKMGYFDCIFDDMNLYNELESNKENKIIIPTQFWKNIISDVSYENIIIYSCLKGNDYTKGLFEKDPLYKELINKIFDNKSNILININEFEKKHKFPDYSYVYINTIKWLYHNYMHLEQGFELCQEKLKEHTVTNKYLFTKHYLY